MNKEKIFYILLTLCTVLFMIFTYPANYEISDINLICFVFVCIIIPFTMAAMFAMRMHYWKVWYQRKKEWGWRAVSVVSIVLLAVILHFIFNKSNFKYTKFGNKIKIQIIKYGKEGNKIVPDTRYILPSKDIEVSWVLEPGSFSPPKIIIEDTTTVKFELDSDSIPVFGIDHRFFWHSKWNYLVYLERKYDDFIWDDKVLSGQGILTTLTSKNQLLVCELVLHDKIPENQKLVYPKGLKPLTGFEGENGKIFRGENAVFVIKESSEIYTDHINNTQKVWCLYKSDSKEGFVANVVSLTVLYI